MSDGNKLCQRSGRRLGENMKGTGLFVSGALSLAVLALSTGPGQTQTTTQNNSQTAGQAQSQTSSSVSQGISSSGSAADASNASLNAGSQNFGINFNTSRGADQHNETVKNVPSVYAPVSRRRVAKFASDRYQRAVRGPASA